MDVGCIIGPSVYIVAPDLEESMICQLVQNIVLVLHGLN